MNLIFLNSFEKKVGENRVIEAQVSISEQQGKWHALWNEPRENGKMEQHVWYEGDHWGDMLKVFRLQISDKTAKGFVPLISSYADDISGLSGKAKMTLMLQYYSESNRNEALYLKLRGWRRELSMKEGKAPFIIASNRLLGMISGFVPKSEEELLQIPGFGENKWRLYGSEMINITNEFERSTNFPLDWVLHEVDQHSFEQWAYRQKEQKVRLQLDKMEVRRKLLAAVEQGNDLNGVQQELSISRRDLIIEMEELSKDGYDVDAWVLTELRSVPAEEQVRAWKAFEEEGDRYLKPVFRKIYSDEQMNEIDLDQAYDWLRLLRIRYRNEKASRSQVS